MSEPILTNDGSPFKTLKSAKVAFTKMKLDASDYAIEEIDGGYQIIESEGKVPEPVVIDSKGRIQMGDYPIIRISPAAKGEAKKIPIGLRGSCLTVERGVNVCLPRAYVGVLDISVEVVHPEVTEGKEAKPYDRPRFPYTFIRNGTREDYINMVKKGIPVD